MKDIINITVCTHHRHTHILHKIQFIFSPNIFHPIHNTNGRNCHSSNIIACYTQRSVTYDVIGYHTQGILCVKIVILYVGNKHETIETQPTKGANVKKNTGLHQLPRVLDPVQTNIEKSTQPSRVTITQNPDIKT